MPVQKVIIMDTCVGNFSEMVNTNDTITLQKKFYNILNQVYKL